MSTTNIQGGVFAHIARRLFHIISITGVVFLYYWFFPDYSESLLPHSLLLGVALVIIIFEIIRIKNRWIFFGQRDYEAAQISAFAWTVVALCILLLLAHDKNIAMAIAVSCAIGDPLLGELRARHVNAVIAMIIAVCVIVLIWWYFHFSILIALVMAVITVLVEKPTFKWIDDNALMLLAPLVVSSLL